MYDVPIAKKIFAVLQFLVVQQLDVGVSAIARGAGLSKGTTFGILAGLVREGYVTKNAITKKYSVGPELFQFSKLIVQRADLATIAKPYMDGLTKNLNRTVFLGVKDDDKIRIVGVSPASALLTVSSPIGTLLPLHAGAPGKILLSLMRDEEIVSYIASQSCSISRREAVDIRPQIREVRRVGHAIDLTGEYTPGIWAVAMALDWHAKPCVLWVAGFKVSLNKKRLTKTINNLHNTVKELNVVLGTRFQEGYHSIKENITFLPCQDRSHQAKRGTAGG
jgi:DNA-binding IclR family transcriptional regulator